MNEPPGTRRLSQQLRPRHSSPPAQLGGGPLGTDASGHPGAPAAASEPGSLAPLEHPAATIASAPSARAPAPNQPTSRSSTSNNKVEFGGMTGGNPRAP